MGLCNRKSEVNWWGISVGHDKVDERSFKQVKYLVSRRETREDE